MNQLKIAEIIIPEKIKTGEDFLTIAMIKNEGKEVVEVKASIKIPDGLILLEETKQSRTLKINSLSEKKATWAIETKKNGTYDLMYEFSFSGKDQKYIKKILVDNF